MAFFSKLKWILGILMVFALIVATNLLDRNNFIKVRDSIVTIYQDRIVAYDLILDFSKVIDQKQLAIVQSDTAFFGGGNKAANLHIEELVERYENTKLTEAEQNTFDKLKSDLVSMQTLETSGSVADPSHRAMLLQKVEDIEMSIEMLSEVQLDEGRRQMKIGESAMNSVELFTQMELYLLLALAIVIQVIILYNPEREQGIDKTNG